MGGVGARPAEDALLLLLADAELMPVRSSPALMAITTAVSRK
jgi:hypothetical protein